MGGGAAAFTLAGHGWRVLLLEKGHANPVSDPNAEAALSERQAYRAQHGYWPERLQVYLNNELNSIWPALGTGVGGSSLLYAAALSRLEPSDFKSRTAPDGRQLGWPLSYGEMTPYYEQAERQFDVCGSADPRLPEVHYELRDPPPMGDRDRYFFDAMQRSGLRPYRLHNAIRYEKGCTECGGHSCPMNCKGDARNRFVVPAQRMGSVVVLEHIEVTRLEHTGREVHSVHAIQKKVSRTFKGRVVLLAAGALSTPAIMLRSRSADAPLGIGNAFNQVGRNLMFHASDFVALWPKQRIGRSGPSRTIALRDFYEHDDEKIGEFQSMGLSAGYGEILTYLHQRYDQSPLRKISLLKHGLRIPAFIGSRLFKEASVFSTIVEDFPYYENRVALDDPQSTKVVVHYKIPDELTARVRRFRSLLRQHLVGIRMVVVNQGVTLNYGHACGTCRAGEDPTTSVVNAEGRVHGVDNLYVVDSSFMPTSGGTNPSLTVAANSLRIAERIAETFAA